MKFYQKKDKIQDIEIKTHENNKIVFFIFIIFLCKCGSFFSTLVSQVMSAFSN